MINVLHIDGMSYQPEYIFLCDEAEEEEFFAEQERVKNAWIDVIGNYDALEVYTESGKYIVSPAVNGDGMRYQLTYYSVWDGMPYTDSKFRYAERLANELLTVAYDGADVLAERL